MRKYQRVLLKLSGESLDGGDSIISAETLARYAQDIKSARSFEVEVGVVIGGGNIYRGAREGLPIDRVVGDQMGMLSTVINSLALAGALEAIDVKAKVLTAVNMEPVGEYYSALKAREYLKEGYVVIIAGGTGNPFFTTDTGAALRAIELDAKVLLKGTRVDGVYSADPELDPKAERYSSISFSEVLRKGLKVMDLTAMTLCMENDMPIVVFNMDKPKAFVHILMGNSEGTLVSRRQYK